MLPPIEPLLELAARLENIPFALGGSGLLAAHGLTDTVRDWDVTTDAAPEVIEPRLLGLNYECIGPNGVFATAAMFRINVRGTLIDLMCRFAIVHDGGIFRFPNDVRGEWRGMRLGSAAAWAEAYRLLGRHEKAALLRNIRD